MTFAIFALIMELTNNLRKLVASLDERKHRRNCGLFKAEGTKCVADTIGAFGLFALFATEDWINSHKELAMLASDLLYRISQRDLTRMSSLSTPQGVLAVYHIPERYINEITFSNNLTLALDGVQDPGNLGTIIRTADWFGITDIICSETTADVWNPKVVQATMGAISRVKLHYGNLHSIIKTANVPVYGTFLEGNYIYDADLKQEGIIVMGNEGNGISRETASLVTDKLFIPSFASSDATSESLNVAVATAITLSEFRRRFANF